MARVPHIYLPPPWPDGPVPLPAGTAHHLAGVLRLETGAALSYTDGFGVVGSGRLGAGMVERGAEHTEERPAPAVAVAAAPPQRAERARFLVEKLAELGVDRLVWLATERASRRVPRADKARAWAVAALEQSRGAYLLEIQGPCPLERLPRPLWVAETGGAALPLGVVEAVTVAIGPEGGFAPDEVVGLPRMGLGRRVLRVETAAVVAAVAALQAVGRVPLSRRTGTARRQPEK